MDPQARREISAAKDKRERREIAPAFFFSGHKLRAAIFVDALRQNGERTLGFDRGRRGSRHHQPVERELIAGQALHEAALHPVDDHAILGNPDGGMLALVGRDMPHLCDRLLAHGIHLLHPGGDGEEGRGPRAVGADVFNELRMARGQRAVGCAQQEVGVVGGIGIRAVLGHEPRTVPFGEHALPGLALVGRHQDRVSDIAQLALVVRKRRGGNRLAADPGRGVAD
jgi:hypothetical protein